MLLFLLACTSPVGSPNEAPDALDPAVDFVLDVRHGNQRDSFTLSDHEGDLILLDVSAFW